MSQNIENENNAEEHEESKSYNLLELLDLEEKLEEESAAVLGGSDDKSCTYNTGYIKRQALYSCLTCCPESKDDLSKAAGVCLACSYKCHENHELIELYTKRNFRCDCPTKKIGESKCLFSDDANDNVASTSQANSMKYDHNTCNVYNNNFGGTYCFCKRPYPDPEDPISDEMIQCVICEDWFHTRHLECSVVPKSSEYGEMICGKCIIKNEFLKYYAGFAINKVEKEKEGVLFNIDTENDGKVLKEQETKDNNQKDDGDTIKVNIEENVKNEEYDIEISKSKEGDKFDEINKRTEVVNEENYEPSAKTRRIEIPIGSDCKKPEVCDGYTGGALFWPCDWRELLCTCVKCKKIYTDLKVTYLLDPEDSIAAYEEKGLKKYDSYYEWAANKISSLGHTQKIDFLMGYNHLKESLGEFFIDCSKKNKTVTETDIKDFFKKLHREKSEILDQQNTQHFCR